MFRDIFEEFKMFFVVAFAICSVVIIMGIVIEVKNNSYKKIKATEENVVDVMEFDDSFFNTIPEEEKKKETTTKEDETIIEEQPIKRLKVKQLNYDDIFKNEIKEDLLSKEMKAKIALAKIHQTSATQVWADDERFENAFKNQPLYKLKEAREKKDIEVGTFGELDEFCDIGGGDCLFASRPTNLEYTITKGTRIPVVLTQEIVSDIPTTVCEAMVTQDITGDQGSNILIPRYSKAICTVMPVTDPSQTRLQLIFTDIFTPNGVRIKGALAGADMVGAEGGKGKVESRLGERVGFPLLTAMIPVTMAYTLPASSTADEDRRNSAIEGVTQAIQPIINSEIDRRLNTMPRITLESGTIMQIKPLENLVFERNRGNKLIPTWQN